jgi:hypothetical protein
MCYWDLDRPVGAQRTALHKLMFVEGYEVQEASDSKVLSFRSFKKRGLNSDPLNFGDRFPLLSHSIVRI